jgi:hypothetical protein
MPKTMCILRPVRVIVIGTIDYYMKVEHKVWEKLLAGCGHDPMPWLVYEEDCGSTNRRTRFVILCTRKGSPIAHTPLHLSLIVAERLPPQSDSFTILDYNVHTRTFIKKDIRVGSNTLLPNCVGILKPSLCTTPMDPSNPLMIF